MLPKIVYLTAQIGSHYDNGMTYVIVNKTLKQAREDKKRLKDKIKVKIYKAILTEAR